MHSYRTFYYRLSPLRESFGYISGSQVVNSSSTNSNTAFNQTSVPLARVLGRLTLRYTYGKQSDTSQYCRADRDHGARGHGSEY
jgi:hypothetical protein